MHLIPWRRKREEGTELAPARDSLTRFHERLDDLLERAMRDPWSTNLFELAPALAGAAPRMDLTETESEVRLQLELPGVEPKDVDIDVSGNMLTVRAEKREEQEEKSRGYRFRERTYGSLQRSVQLPAHVDAEKSSASYKNGVLTITLPKHPGAQPKRIAIRGS